MKKYRRKLVAKQKEITDRALSENRSLTAEESAEFERIQNIIDDIDRNLDEFGEENGDQGNDNEGNGNDESNKKSIVDAERSRISDISQLCRDFKIDPNPYIKNGSSIDAVRGAILEKLKEDGAPVNSGVRMGKSENEKFVGAAADAIMMRAGVSVTKTAEGANGLRGMSLRDMAIECLSRFSGQSVNKLLRMNNDDLYTELCRDFSNPTSVFPSILDNAVKKSIVELYNAVPTTFEKFTSKGTLTDFKESKDNEYLLGGAGELLRVPENGELVNDKPKDILLPKRKLETYGRQFSMSRQAFINDDVGFITKIPGLYAQKAKKTIDKQVYQILFSNEKIFDGKTLFCKDHNNLISTGTKPTQASIQAIITQMQKQTDPFGDAIYVTPKYIIVPIGYGFDLAVIFKSAQVTGSNNNDVNPLYQANIEIVESPVLNVLAGEAACPWFMAADQSSAKGIQVDYLNGQDRPTIVRSQKPGVLGFVWDIYMDWGINVSDYRGLAKNNGVKLS